MLFEYLNHKNLYSLSKIEETLDSLYLKISPLESMDIVVPKFFDELKTISPRDRFELFFDVSGNHVKISDCSVASYEVIAAHVAEYKDEKEYELELRVQKKLEEETLSIYFFEKFAEYLNGENVYNLINSISSHFLGNLKFEIFSSIKGFGSNTIYFFGSSDSCETNNEKIMRERELERESKLALLFENASVTNLPIKLLPSDFNLLSAPADQNINSTFHKLCSVLSLIFLSNSSELDRNGNFSYKISGYKSISDKNITNEKLQKDHKMLFKIYSWAFEGGNSSDKIGLVRNVLSIHLDDNGRIKLDDEVWEAVRSNYQIYLKGNIQSYLEIKNKIGEIIIESTTKTYAMADELLDSLKNKGLTQITTLNTA